MKGMDRGTGGQDNNPRLWVELSTGQLWVGERGKTTDRCTPFTMTKEHLGRWGAHVGTPSGPAAAVCCNVWAEALVRHTGSISSHNFLYGSWGGEHLSPDNTA